MTRARDEIAEVIDPADFATLASQWPDTSSAWGGLFASHTWLQAWLTAFADSETRVAVARKPHGVVAGGVVQVRGRGAVSLDLDETPWPAFALDARLTNPYGPMFTALEAIDGVRRIDLVRFPTSEGRHVEAFSEGEWRRIARDPRPSHGIDVPESLDAYFATRPKKVRSELRRKTRKLERELADVTFGVEADPDRAFSALTAIEDDSWKDEGETSITADPKQVAFYRQVASWSDPTLRSEVRVLGAAGEPVAYVLCTFHAGVCYALKTSFRQDFAPLSPGSVLFVKLIEALAREGGVRRIELLGSDARWKRHLASSSVETCTHELLRAGFRASAELFVHGVVKPLVKTTFANNPRLEALYGALRRRLPSKLP